MREQVERCPTGAERVVLARRRDPEDAQHRVTDELLDDTEGGV